MAFGVGNGSSAALGGRSATQRARFTKVMVDCGEILVSAKSHCRKINQQKKRGGRTQKRELVSISEFTSFFPCQKYLIVTTAFAEKYR